MVEVPAGAWLRLNFCNIELEAPKPPSLMIPKNPKTVGEHIRKVRLERELFQKDVALLLGVNEMSVTNWETNKSKPMLIRLPAIIDFLGYIPECCKDIPQLKNPLFLYRVKHKKTQLELANKLHIDPTTVQAIELMTRPTLDKTNVKIKMLIYPKRI